VGTADYPGHWEADVVLRDGGTCHVRPITPDDAQRLVDFHNRLSPETIYFRFFAPYPQLSERDIKRFTNVDYEDRAALVALVGDEFVGVARYDRVNRDDAEVAFTVRDDYQGFGLGSVLLEHIAAAARERGVSRFVAEVLPGNRRMMAVFVDAGYTMAQEFDDGVISLHFDIEPTAQSRAVLEAREQRSEAMSIERLISPASIAVVGASRTPGAIGHELLRHVMEGGFRGPIYPIHPEADQVLGLPAFKSVGQAPGPVDLAIVAVPAQLVQDVVVDCAESGVKGLVVVSSGFGEAGPEGAELQRKLVSLARGSGMRVVGPACFGLVNTDPGVAMNASLAPVPPWSGRIGFFSQSGSLGATILDSVRRHGLGLSTFVSAGNRADVSGNDLLQYWMDDAATEVVLLYLESLGNPRKFTRIARRLAARKPIVAVRSGRTTQAYPLGNRVRRTGLSPAAVDAVFARAGIVQTDTLAQLFDVAALLACQELPRGNSVAVIGNSPALGVLAAGACEAAGLSVVGDPIVLPIDVGGAQLAGALAGLVEDPVVQAVLLLHVPPLGDADDDVREAVVAASMRAAKPLVAVLPAAVHAASLLVVPDESGAAGHGSVPLFTDVESAVGALAQVAEYAEWLRTPRGTVPELSNIDSVRARELVEDWVGGSEDPILLTDAQAQELLVCYGVRVWPLLSAVDEDDAVELASELGYPVVLRTRVPSLGQRADLGGVRLSLENERAVRTAFRSMLAFLDSEAASQLAVQRMAPSGVACVVASTEDALFGPVVSFRLGGVVPALLDDRAYAVPPITDVDARDVVRAPAAAPMLTGGTGSPPVALADIEDLVLRIGRLAEDLAEVASLELDPVVVSGGGLAVLGAAVTVCRPEVRSPDARRLNDSL
jgi:acyl-CoA synthetase (NDP forming)/GNAT superfamily N-acetyltransferase